MNTIHIIVHSRLRIHPVPPLSQRAVDELKEQFTHPNPDHEKWTTLPPHIRRFKREPSKTIATWRVEPTGSLSLPRGGTDRLRDVLADHGLTASFDDRSSDGTLAPWPGLTHNMQLFDYQEKMVQAALRVRNCILRAPCASGKTTVGIRIASRAGVSTLIVVPTSRIFDEWVKRLGFELGLEPDQIGWFGKGKKRIRPITVATVDTLKRHVHEVARLFGCVIFDEVHKAPANSYYPAIDALPCRYRIGISADERRKDKKHGINYDLFGKVVVDVPHQALIDKGRIIPVAVRLVPTGFRADWYASLSANDKRRPDLYLRLLEEIVNDTERTALAVSLAAQEVAAHPTLVFSHRVEHCARMRTDILAAGRHTYQVGVILGEKAYKTESDATVLGLQTGTHRCGVGTYQSIGTGIDLPAIEAGVAVTPVLANKQNFVQARDRLSRVDRRPNATKRTATLYVLWDRDVFGDRPLRNAVAWSMGRVEVLDGGEWVPAREYLNCSDGGGLIP